MRLPLSLSLLLFLLGSAVEGRAQGSSGPVPANPVVGAQVPCANGQAAGFPCSNVDLLAFLPISSIGGATAVVGRDTTARATLNDIWGWTDPQTGREYALVGRSDGTAFVDISDPTNPVYLGILPSHYPVPSPWRDLKVYADHVYVVADAIPHGMQVFDLTQLRNVTNPPVVFTATTHYNGFGPAHNVVVNEETGYAYAVGIQGQQVGTCGPGLHIIDIRTPASPRYAGCFADLTTGIRGDGYTHDAQCVIYRGPDEPYRGREICFNSNETAISIADVTDKAAPQAISTASYPTAAYVHQGWLTEDHRYFLQDDELDEGRFVFRTRTLVWDLQDLDNPVLVTEYLGPTPSIDHNQYIVGRYSFQANYKSGLRILDISQPAAPREIGFFDVYPADDNRGYDGAWSNYPFFRSGVVIVSGIGQGLFVVKPTNVQVAAEAEALPEAFALAPAYPNPFNPATTLQLTVPRAQHVQVTAYDLLGRAVARLHEGVLPAGTHRFTFEAAGLPSGPYLIRAVSETASVARFVTLQK